MQDMIDLQQGKKCVSFKSNAQTKEKSEGKFKTKEQLFFFFFLPSIDSKQWLA